MGRVAGAPGGRRLTLWAFALDAVPRGGSGAVALVLSPAQVAALSEPAAAGERRGAARRRVLSALADRVLALSTPPRLVAVDGIRHLAGTGWFASVAERDGWVGAALAPLAVGIDEAAAAADAVLAGVVVADLAAWHGLAGIWAAREAVLKAVGRDLTRDLGGWRFGPGIVTAEGVPPHRVEVVARDAIVAALAYAGG